MSDCFDHAFDALEEYGEDRTRDTSKRDSYRDRTYSVKYVKCKYCGEPGLKWQKDNNGKWVLMAGLKTHICNTQFDDMAFTTSLLND